MMGEHTIVMSKGKKSRKVPAYEDVHKLILSRAHSWHKSYPSITVDDLVSEASTVYMRVVAVYEAKKGKFSGLLAKSLDNHYGDFCPRYARQRPTDMGTNPDMVNKPSHHVEWQPMRRARFRDDVHSLSRRAQRVVGMVLSEEGLIDKIGLQPTVDNKYIPRSAVSKLRKYLRTRLGWRREDVNETIEEIRGVLR